VSLRHKRSFVSRDASVANAAQVLRHPREVQFASRRHDPRLQALVVAHDQDDRPAAETWRRVGESAQELGLPRPSYHTVRVLVRAERLRRRARTATRRAALEVAGALATSRAVDLPIALDALAHARAKERLVTDSHKPP
jgi:hypothetical protein